MPFSMSKCAKGEKRKADDVDLSSSQPAPTKTPKVSEIKIEAPISRRNPRARPIAACMAMAISEIVGGPPTSTGVADIPLVSA